MGVIAVPHACEDYQEGEGNTSIDFQMYRRHMAHYIHYILSSSLRPHKPFTTRSFLRLPKSTSEISPPTPMKVPVCFHASSSRRPASVARSPPVQGPQHNNPPMWGAPTPGNIACRLANGTGQTLLASLPAPFSTRNLP